MATDLSTLRARCERALESALTSARLFRPLHAATGPSPAETNTPENAVASETSRLVAAMRHAVLGGGKRLRPLLVYGAGQALAVPFERLDPAAVAIELIHAYSLVHDDLPAMDDDDLRRGLPTVHRAYDEATAILAGDALQALAFEVLADNPSAPVTGVLAQVQALAQAAGPAGMVGGQALDLALVATRPTLDTLTRMHRMKTGALIACAVRLGALAAEAPDPAQLDALDRYASDLGLAFQIQDDVLDEIGDSRVTGKASGADRARDKPTYTALLGVEVAQRRADDLLADALAALKRLPGDTTLLGEIAYSLMRRQR